MKMEQFSPVGGGRPPEQAQVPALEYTAQVTSYLVNGEAKLTVGEDGLAVTALFDAADIPYADMTALELADYTITIKTHGGSFTLSRMGNWCQPFYDALFEAYNQKVLKALFVSDKLLMKTSGHYQYVEDGFVVAGVAPLQVHENCVCILPPNLAARRIPLCFLSALRKGEHDLSLELKTGEHYTFSKLGREHQPFVSSIEKQLRVLRENALAAVKEIDPALTTAQASNIAKLMPEGVAAPLGALACIAPSFVDALNGYIGESRISESADAFAELCDPAQICVGIKKDFARSASPAPDGGMAALAQLVPGASPAQTATDKAETPERKMIWLIAPGQKPGTAAVEFAGGEETAAATFFYQFGVPWDAFWQKLNYAMEAINFKREVIRLSDEELQKAEQADNRMAVQRNPALRYIRSCFAGRAIHRSMAAWQSEVAAHLSDDGV